MDILSSLETPTEDNYKSYVISSIEETFKNFIEVDSIYFDKLYKPVSFRSFVGMANAPLSELDEAAQFLNVTTQKSFTNLQLTISNYSFDLDPDSNLAKLNVDLTCGLLNIPPKMKFTVDLKGDK